MRTTDASQLASEVANARSGAQPSGSYVLTASLHPKSFSIAEAADSVVPFALVVYGLLLAFRGDGYG